MSESQQRLRQWKLLQLLADSRFGIPLAELAREFHVSDRSIRRDLAVLETVDFQIQEILGEPVEQEAYPQGFVYHRGSLYLIAWSSRRAEIRTFKVERIDGVGTTGTCRRNPE